jgi:copper chaperone CopZ
MRDLMEELTLAIDGMSCGHCVSRVKQTLTAVPGVHVRDVSIGSASVAYDASATTPEGITMAVSAAGYPARATNAGLPR